MIFLLMLIIAISISYTIITHEGRMGSGKTLSCVPAGTNITTASGQKNIEDIQVKDLILSYNIRSSVKELRRVSNIFVRESSSLVAILLDDRSQLMCTAEHPIYVDKVGWVEAGNIDKYVGYFIMGVDGYPRIKSVILISGRKEKVYNLEVEINNNYFANNVLVHNCTAFAYNEWLKGKRVIANYQLAFVEHFIATCRDPKIQDVEDVKKVYGLDPPETFSLDYFVEHLTDREIYNSYLIFDEAYLYMDSRNTATRMNKLFSWFLAQTRKRGVDLAICFPGSVKILIEDEKGNIASRNICDVKVGDRVLSHSRFGDNEFRTVKRVFSKKSRELWTLKFSGDKEVKCTPEHPFFVGGNWIRARDLKIGDTCLSYYGGPVMFRGYGTSYYSEIDVYNLEVEKNNNYFANDMLVHNCTIHYDHLDKRLRRAVTLRVLCRFNERRKVVTSRMIDLKSGNRNTIHLYAPDFWDLYDTKEIIDVPENQVYLPDSLSISGRKQ